MHRLHYYAHQQALTGAILPYPATLPFALGLLSGGDSQARLCRIGIYQAHGIVIGTVYGIKFYNRCVGKVLQ
jgi:hypothetical protein